MRIEPPKPVLMDRDALARELTALLHAPAVQTPHPCRNCATRPCSGPYHCGFTCTPDGGDIEPAPGPEIRRYPIEPAVVPLIVELDALRLVQKCWLCEGHRDAGDNATMRPRVWFHSRRADDALLFSDHLDSLWARASLRHPWQVRLVTTGEHGCATYSIEPALDALEAADIVMLHYDLAVIGAGLAHRIRELAAQVLSFLGSSA